MRSSSPRTTWSRQVGVLSGGEKNRLALARMLLAPAPLLVLDEPTNHLDMNSRAALEEALVDFPGTLVIVSHDRAFLNRLATVVVDVGGGGTRRYEGGWEDFVWQRERRQEQEAEAQAAKAPAPADEEKKENRGSKARRKEAALRRDKLKPFLAEVKKLEIEHEKIENKLRDLDDKLSDLAFYESSDGSTAFRERADLASKLELTEGDWLRAQEKLENAERELDRAE